MPAKPPGRLSALQVTTVAPMSVAPTHGRDDLAKRFRLGSLRGADPAI